MSGISEKLMYIAQVKQTLLESLKKRGIEPTEGASFMEMARLAGEADGGSGGGG